MQLQNYLLQLPAGIVAWMLPYRVK